MTSHKPPVSKGRPLPKTCPVKGFKFASFAAGLRYANRPDLALVVADGPCKAAGLFTRNQVVAAPVIVSRDNLRGKATHRAVLINAGRANAGTGKQGMEDAKTSTAALAKVLGCAPAEIFLCSTGIIGQRINIKKFVSALPDLAAQLGPGKFPELARAIMTTDTFPKYALRKFSVGGRTYHIAGIAKGAGMIEPNMATLLSVLVTDAPLSKAALQKSLKIAADDSFNAITIDGDTSTNDTLLLLSSGAAGGGNLDKSRAALGKFQEALTALCTELAKLIVWDGEGARKLVTIHVTGARSEKEARQCAKTIGNSPLVKTAFAGEDPNWGRIIAAAGRSPAKFNPEKVNLWIGKVRVMKDGRPVGTLAAEKGAHAVMEKPAYEVALDLGAGKGRSTIYTCDFTHEYISINADYRS